MVMVIRYVWCIYLLYVGPVVCVRLKLVVVDGMKELCGLGIRVAARIDGVGCDP